MNEVLCGSLAERRRLEIIEAAERCVMKTGLHRLTLRDIAREQGGSLGNIYNYFANKEEIVEAIVERETDRFIAIAVQGGKAQGEGTLGERLREHMTSFVDAYLDSDGAREPAPLRGDLERRDQQQAKLLADSEGEDAGAAGVEPLPSRGAARHGDLQSGHRPEGAPRRRDRPFGARHPRGFGRLEGRHRRGTFALAVIFS